MRCVVSGAHCNSCAFDWGTGSFCPRRAEYRSFYVNWIDANTPALPTEALFLQPTRRFLFFTRLANQSRYPVAVAVVVIDAVLKVTMLLIGV